MRKITQQARDAFWGGGSFVGSNTKVKIAENGHNKMFLHGNMIAELNFKGELIISSCGWQTNTTKERLNGILPAHLAVVQRDFTWYLVNSKDNTKTLFTDGMEISL